LGYVIAKGGITSQTLLAEGFGLGTVHLQGQLLPGLSLVLPSAAIATGTVPGGFEGLPILTFPGNLGDRETLLRSWQWMEGEAVVQGEAVSEGQP